MEEFTEEFDVLQARRKAAIEKLKAAADPAETARLREELAEIERAIGDLGEDEAF